MLFYCPNSIDEVKQMIRDQVQENIHLDYKASAAIQKGARPEIAKDVSSFANSDGGVLVYGVIERDQLPIAIDGGVDDKQCSREWIESAIMTGITPRIGDVRISPFPISPGKSLYVINVGKSFRGPHQASDKKYYKRHNFSSVPMEDYEIADVRARRMLSPTLVTFELAEHRRFVVVFDVANIGDVTAEDLRFEFSESIPWPTGSMPRPLHDGIRRLAPKQRLRFRYHTFLEMLKEGSGIPTEFSVRVSYFHPDLGARTGDEWPINLEAFRDSMGVRSELEEQTKAAVDALKKITDQLERFRRAFEPMLDIAGATGLRLSSRTLRDLRSVVVEGNEPAPLDPMNCGPAVFQETLDVGVDVAHSLHFALSQGCDIASLKAIPGMTGDLMERLRQRFILPEENQSASDQERGQAEWPVDSKKETD